MSNNYASRRPPVALTYRELSYEAIKKARKVLNKLDTSYDRSNLTEDIMAIDRVMADLHEAKQLLVMQRTLQNP